MKKSAMQMQNPLDFILHKIKTGYGKERIKGIFKKKYPSVPIKDFNGIYEQACLWRNAETLERFKENKFHALHLATQLKELTDITDGKHLLVTVYDDKRNECGVPCVIVSGKSIKSGKHIVLATGIGTLGVMEIVKRATICTTEQRMELKKKLDPGYDIMPTLDGKYILFRNKEFLLEDKIEMCLHIMDIQKLVKGLR